MAKKPKGRPVNATTTTTTAPAPAPTAAPVIIVQQQPATGWTVFTPSADTKFVAVDSVDGVDAGAVAHTTEAAAKAAPCKTIAVAKALMRDTYPDWMLLKKGCTWTDEAIDLLTISGRSAAEPMLFSSYGTGARPLLKVKAGTNNCGIGASGSGNGDNVAVAGIEFYAYTRDPDNPSFDATKTTMQFPLASWGGTGVNFLLIEDCKFSFGNHNVAVDNSATPGTGIVKVRRSVIVDAYDENVHHCAGLLIEGAAQITVEDNFLDHNGWNDTVIVDDSNRVFNRNCYLQADNDQIIFRNNISARSGSEGVQVRYNGSIDNNLFVGNPIGYQIGASLSQTTAARTTTSLTAKNNVTTESCDISVLTTRSMGVLLFNCNGSGVVLTNDMFIHAAGPSTTNQQAITPRADGAPSDVTGITISNSVIFGWQVGLSDETTAHTLNTPGLMTDTNGDNAEYSFSDPSRTVGSYAGTISLTATTAAFLTACRAQSKDNWNPALTAPIINAYLRAGYGLSAV